MPLTHTIRALRRAPAFSAIAIVSLALAIAVNTSLFGFVDALVNPPVPYANAGRVFSTYTIGGDRSRPLPPDATERALRRGLLSAEETASFLTFNSMVAGGNTAEDRLVVAASPNLFELLGARPEVGRSLASSADTPDGAIISYTVWTRWFLNRPLTDRLELTIGSRKFSVVGVMPRNVHFPVVTSVWIPMTSLPAEIAAKAYTPEIAFRLRSAATPDAARRELNASLRQLASRYGTRNSPGAVVIPLHVRSLPRRSYSVAMLIAALVLLIGCANLGTMMLARGFARRREVAIRIALGAGRRAIWADVLAECGVITVAGVALAMLLTLWAMSVIPHLVAGQLPVLGDVEPRLGWRVFAFASIASAAIVIIAGAIPAARAGRTDPGEAMKDGGAATYRIRDRYNPLLIVEVALSVGLLTTAGLYAQYSSKLAAFKFTYAADRLITAQLETPPSSVAPSAVPQFYASTVTRLASIPGAERAATRYFNAPDHGVVTAEGGLSGNRWINLSRVAYVSPDYLRTLGIGVLRGRDFTAGDNTGTAAVVIVDELAARTLWPTDHEPTNRQMKLGAADSPAPWLRVVGVAKRVELEPLADPDLPAEPQVYVVVPNDPQPSRELIVRGSGVDRNGLALSIRGELQSIAPWLGMAHVTPWLESYENTVTSSAFLAATFTAFGAFGLLLCGVGLFGVTAYTVSRRQREFALHVALGAPTARIARSVLHDASVAVLGGIGFGALGTLWATSGVRENLASSSLHLVVAMIVAEVALMLVAFVASYRPLLRATRADPADILRAS